MTFPAEYPYALYKILRWIAFFLLTHSMGFKEYHTCTNPNGTTHYWRGRVIGQFRMVEENKTIPPGGWIPIPHGYRFAP